MKKTAKTILITGTSTGIGRETALRLAKAGHRVFAGVRRKIDKDELEKLNPNIKGVYLDITNPSSIDKAFWFIIKNTDKIDVLINNAGIAVAGPVELLPVKKIKEQFDVNVFGTLNVTQKFFPILNGGLIINISSLASTGIFPYIAPYCASKRALDILFNCLMLENKDNIKVVSVKPAVIKTPIWDKSIKKAQDVFSEFNEKLSNTGALIGTYETTERLLSKSMDKDRVASIMEEINEARSSTFPGRVRLEVEIASVSKAPSLFSAQEKYATRTFPSVSS